MSNVTLSTDVGIAPSVWSGQSPMVTRNAVPSGGVFRKLIDVRVELQSMPIQKSGHNKFAGYQYFELGDFLPSIQTLFAKYGLVDVITFNKEYAQMQVIDVNDGSFVTFTSPMADATLKGCHPIQNLGAVETYQRRYLYVTALAIVEHDALDATTGAVEPEPKRKQAQAQPAAPVMKAEDQIIFVDGLMELSDQVASLSDLSSLWKNNQNQIDRVKKDNPELFERLQKQFALVKTKFQKDEA